MKYLVQLTFEERVPFRAQSACRELALPLLLLPLLPLPVVALAFAWLLAAIRSSPSKPATNE